MYSDTESESEDEEEESDDREDDRAAQNNSHKTSESNDRAFTETRPRRADEEHLNSGLNKTKDNNFRHKSERIKVKATEKADSKSHISDSKSDSSKPTQSFSTTRKKDEIIHGNNKNKFFLYL